MCECHSLDVWLVLITHNIMLTHIHSHTQTQTLTHTHTHMHTLTHTHTHTHIHTQTPTLGIVLPAPSSLLLLLPVTVPARKLRCVFTSELAMVIIDVVPSTASCAVGAVASSRGLRMKLCVFSRKAFSCFVRLATSSLLGLPFQERREALGFVTVESHFSACSSAFTCVCEGVGEGVCVCACVRVCARVCEWVSG